MPPTAQPRTEPAVATAPKPAVANARMAAVEPIQQQLPERVVEMLNAQRGREAVTQIARAAQGAGDVAVAPPQNAATAAPAPAAGIAEPRVVVEPGAPAIQFAPARPANLKLGADRFSAGHVSGFEIGAPCGSDSRRDG